MDTKKIKELIELLLEKTQKLKKPQIEKLIEQLGQVKIKELNKLTKLLNLKTEEERTREKKLLTRNEIAKILKVSNVTIKYYSDLKILPFQTGETEKRKRRYFELNQVRERLKEIKDLQRKGMSIIEILDYYSNKGGGVK